MRPIDPENQSPLTSFPAQPPLVDSFARKIDYIRVSVTDRCDYRCVYCMSENMNFLPKADLLTLMSLELLLLLLQRQRRILADVFGGSF